MTDHVTSPRGVAATFASRPDSSDLSVVGSTFGLWGGPAQDEYRLRDLRVTGTFVDVGAHIGTVAIAVLLDNPEATAVCIEPLADNCRMIEVNAELNGLTDRLTVLHAAIGKGRRAEIAHGFVGDLASERWIGSLAIGAAGPHTVEKVRTVTLRSLGPIDVLKLDCEGCEWKALAEPAARKVRVIVGEAHNDNAWPDTIHGLLDATHEVEILANPGGTGLFRAVRR